ncbi:MAG: MBL fold metallo-hydrolase [Terracidiphilus sp.]|jgi:phosphoribosyl 1,2-cyclic phosphodiesterase
MATDSSLRLKFWGVRGSTATPRADHLAFGGNTPCVEVRAPGDDTILVIDAGTGVRNLAESLDREFPGQPLRVSFLMTHFHWDHIQGLPFFSPLYDSRHSLAFCSGRSETAIREMLEGQMSHPYFPVPFEMVAARRSFIDSREGEIGTAKMRVRSFPLNHPQGACGFRIEAEGAVAVTVFDHEHGNASIDEAIRAQTQNADLLIYDAQYTPEEYERKQGWGHSTWAEATRLARDANVGKLILFHHDPGRDDNSLRAIAAEAQNRFANTEAAAEGVAINL